MDKEDEKQKQEWEQPCATSHKRRREASRSRAVTECTSFPFPLQFNEKRKKACHSLYEAVHAINFMQSNRIYKMIMACLINNECTQGDVVQFSNLLLASMTEYHLTASVRQYSAGPSHPHITEYTPPEDEFSTVDISTKDAKAAVLRLAAWLHRVGMYYTTDKDTAQSQRCADHQVGPLLEYFLAPGCVSVTSDEVINRVMMENLKDAHSQLQECKSELQKLKTRFKDLREVLEETWIKYDNMHQARDSARREELKARKKILKKDIKQCEAEIETHE